MCLFLIIYEQNITASLYLYTRYYGYIGAIFILFNYEGMHCISLCMMITAEHQVNSLQWVRLV